MIDAELQRVQVERERRVERRNTAVRGATVTVLVWGAAYVIASLLGYRGTGRVLITVLGGSFASAFILGGVWLASRMAGRAARVVYDPGGGQAMHAPFSRAEALWQAGDYAGSAQAFDAARAATPAAVGHADSLRAEAELNLGRGGDPARARDLLVRLRQDRACTRDDERYATQRLIDLYFGLLQDEGRALVEMRRLADRFPGTRDAEGALAELARRKAERPGA